MFYANNKVKFEVLRSIDFKGKTFHLSGGFKGTTKEEFSKKIEALGGKCRGFGNEEHVNLRKTDYFVQSQLMDGRPYGGKAVYVHDHKKDYEITMITDLECLRHINSMDHKKVLNKK